ncbi:MAG: hypothetical protein WKF89_02235 [Chitinophagaceae bacterium]
MRKSLLYNTLLLIATLPAFSVRAQPTFQFKCFLEKVSRPGFYRIVLGPPVIAKCTDALTDIRILDEKGNQVAYLLQDDPEVFSDKYFQELPILSIRKETDKQTHIIIQNNLNKAINALLLIIKNNEAHRAVNISGSDDYRQWFIIKENISLNNFASITSDDSFIQSIAFPSSSYKYFKMVIIGKDLLPVNIVKAGVYEGHLNHTKFLPITSPLYSQHDSNNSVSYVSVHFNDEYLVNRLQFNVDGIKFFNRKLRIKESSKNNFAWQKELTVNSKEPISYVLNVKTRELLLEIENEDNPPLRISAVKAYQLSKSLVAYLEPSKAYELAFGNSRADAPRYDLGFFRDSISNGATEIKLGPVLNHRTADKPVTPAGKTNTLVLWIVIGLVLSLLLLLTFRMTKELKRKEDQK